MQTAGGTGKNDCTDGSRGRSANGESLSENSFRLAKFRTRTVLVEENGRKAVYKCPLDPEALPFLKIIVERELQNVPYLGKNFDVLRGVLKHERIEYDYLAYPRLIELIGGHLSDGNHERAHELLCTYVGRINSLGRIQTVPKEFLSITGENAGADRIAVDCLLRGLLDLTPRNILVDGERWVVIDNEWSFDFPVPVALVLFRAIREMAMELQREIRASTTVSNPSVGVFARGLQIYYVPEHWLSHITDVNISLDRLLRWEMSFQRYVTGSLYDTVGRIKRNPRTRVHFSSKAVESNAGMLDTAAQLLKKVPGMRKLGHLFERKAVHWRK